jgi:hypothetical protein
MFSSFPAAASSSGMLPPLPPPLPPTTCFPCLPLLTPARAALLPVTTERGVAPCWSWLAGAACKLRAGLAPLPPPRDGLSKESRLHNAAAGPGIPSPCTLGTSGLKGISAAEAIYPPPRSHSTSMPPAPCDPRRPAADLPPAMPGMLGWRAAAAASAATSLSSAASTKSTTPPHASAVIATCCSCCCC